MDHHEPTALSNHLASLHDKHQRLESEIEYTQRRVGSADFYLKQLKRRKLILKDHIQFVIESAKASAANTH